MAQGWVCTQGTCNWALPHQVGMEDTAEASRAGFPFTGQHATASQTGQHSGEVQLGPGLNLLPAREPLIHTAHYPHGPCHGPKAVLPPRPLPICHLSRARTGWSGVPGAACS